MKKVIFGIIAIVVLATGAIFVVAQRAGHKDGRGFGMGRGQGHMMGMALRGLDLTDEQKASVKTIMEASRTNIQPLMQQKRDIHTKLAALGTDGSFDEAQVTALATEQGNITAQMIVEKEKVKSQISALLTDAQKAKAAEMRTKFQERMKGHKGFGKDHKGFGKDRQGSEF